MGKTTVAHLTVNDLLTSDIKLPSYQRAEVWTNDQKFRLLLSILCDFPIGSIVLHKEKDSEELWLMDGQQRRSALGQMSGPKQFRNIFKWMDEIFKTKIDSFEDDLKKYVLVDFLEATSEDDDEIDDFEYNPLQWHEEETDETKNTGKEYLRYLVRLRQYMGKRTTLALTEEKTRVYPFEKLFVKKKWFTENHFPFRNQGEFEPALILDLLYDYRKDSSREHREADDFINYFHDSGPNCEWAGNDQKKRDKKKEQFAEVIRENYENQIFPTMEIIHKIRNKIGLHNVGRITYEEDSKLVGSGYDLPSIFRFINNGGAKMEDVELFASAGRWVSKEAQPELKDNMKTRISDLLTGLKVHNPDAETTKWHICSIYSKAFYQIHSDTDNSLWWLGYQKRKTDLDIRAAESIRAGFKLFSLFHSDSIAKASWSQTYKIGKNDDRWTDETALADYQEISKLIVSDDYFERVFSWKKSIPELAGGSDEAFDIALLTAGIRQIWLTNGKPKSVHKWDKRKRFILRARILFDYYVYRKIGDGVITTGAADQKLTDKINEIKNGDIPRAENKQWADLISSLIDDGKYLNGEDYTSSGKSPKESKQARWSRLLLTHIYSINGIKAPSDDDSHVDHIVSRENWADYIDTLDEEKKEEANYSNNLVNLCLLDDSTNSAKNSNGLDHADITNNNAIKGAIEKYAGIKESKFSTYASANEKTYENLKKDRINFLKTDFLKNRQEKFLKSEKIA